MDESFSQPLLLLMFLIISGFFSGSETAFFSLTKLQLKQLESHRTPASIRIFNLLKHPNQLLILILFGNTLANVAASATSALIAIQVGNALQMGKWLVMSLQVILMTFILLLLGEITPKLLAYASPVKFAKISSSILIYLRIILWPVIKILEFISNFFSSGKEHRHANITADELKHILHSTNSKTELEESEKDIISSIFRFSTTEAREIMTPRVDMITSELSEGIDAVKQCIIDSGHSKIPIYNQTIDNIVGFIYGKDILLSKGSKTINSLLREAFFITENTKIQNLLNQFQTKQFQVAVVVDEYGGTSGLITLEDILEELVGEIMDEYDSESLPIMQIAEDKYQISGTVAISELNDKFGLRIDSESYDNLAEFIYDKFNRVPTKNETLKLSKNFKFTISNIKDQRINHVLLQIKPDEKTTI
ncbi:MAG: hemolysin family protein [Candidatus Cloacimonadales bacterium]